jgi:hypothetical protein
MDHTEVSRIGGWTSAQKRRTKALSGYYSNPVFCKLCGKLIEIKEIESVSQAKRKKFCGEECRKISMGRSVWRGNRTVGLGRPKPKTGRLNHKGGAKKYCEESSGPCTRCGLTINYNLSHRKEYYHQRKYCDSCLLIVQSENGKRVHGENALTKPAGEYSKGELMDWKDYYRAKGIIIKHAAKVYNESGRPKICHICNYNHIQICHIRDVSDFPDDALISEINALSNLVALCPNHHREFDRRHFSVLS